MPSWRPVKLTGIIFIMIIGSMIFSSFLTTTEVGIKLAQFIEGSDIQHGIDPDRDHGDLYSGWLLYGYLCCNPGHPADFLSAGLSVWDMIPSCSEY